MGALLAIETSCDETAAAVVADDGTVRSSVVATQIPVHARYGGVVPELASRSHLTALGPVIAQALEEAGAEIADMQAVAVTAGPGLAGCLLVGLQTAKALAWTRSIPLVPVDHIEAHVHAVALKDARGAGEDPPEFPYVALAVSGGHTSLLLIAGPGELEVLGQTLDDAAGEAFDKVAKMMGLPYPGGVHIDRLSAEGDAEAIALPRPMLSRGLDFSFSGLKTAVRYALEGSADIRPADMAASVQEAIAEVLVTKSLRACREVGVDRLVLAGGVACNSRLRSLAKEHAARVGVGCWATPARYCTDNAAMIGGLGVQMLARGEGLTGAALASLDIHVTRRPVRTR